ncbi:uncharacterized protein CTRU02_201259 [Colletotrichum truncatum]|uniref:Uncharacterized protein n=1 Tax=Colletotrichum truncatum TaxID=5467 RepID=A0ACC3ZGU7_COLTU|nr:uncharacterized protein CTRU02_08049 [Colletotrichum truncatum]KAF6790529.1 hypothetical protein CTRU02_08049 [Colletotrichum truncatum]
MERYLPNYEGHPRNLDLDMPQQGTGYQLAQDTNNTVNHTNTNDGQVHTPTIKSILFSMSTPPADTMMTNTWRAQNIPVPDHYLEKRLEALFTVKYGIATYELLISCFEPNRRQDGRGCYMATNALNPMEQLLKTVTNAAEDEKFRNHLKDLSQMVIASCKLWINPFIARGKAQTYRLQLIEPVSPIQSNTLIPWDMSIWSDHRIHEALAELVFTANGFSLRYLKDGPGRGFW